MARKTRAPKPEAEKPVSIATGDVVFYTLPNESPARGQLRRATVLDNSDGGSLIDRLRGKLKLAIAKASPDDFAAELSGDGQVTPIPGCSIGADLAHEVAILDAVPAGEFGEHGTWSPIPSK